MTDEHTEPADQTRAARMRELNEMIRYTMWSVFRAAQPLDVESRRAAAADADVMVWWHASRPDALQEAYGLLRRTAVGQRLVPVWSAMALHRPAEFNKSHIPAFLAGEPARNYVCVYPFVRSYDWYLLPD